MLGQAGRQGLSQQRRQSALCSRAGGRGRPTLLLLLLLLSWLVCRIPLVAAGGGRLGSWRRVAGQGGQHTDRQLSMQVLGRLQGSERRRKSTPVLMDGG